MDMVFYTLLFLVLMLLGFSAEYERRSKKILDDHEKRNEEIQKRGGVRLPTPRHW
jgi:hypothetical protein